jgi:methyl coenzyme M reductase subunit D
MNLFDTNVNCGDFTQKYQWAQAFTDVIEGEQKIDSMKKHVLTLIDSVSTLQKRVL